MQRRVLIGIGLVITAAVIVTLSLSPLMHLETDSPEVELLLRGGVEEQNDGWRFNATLWITKDASNGDVFRDVKIEFLNDDQRSYHRFGIGTLRVPADAQTNISVRLERRPRYAFVTISDFSTENDLQVTGIRFPDDSDDPVEEYSENQSEFLIQE